MNRADDCQLFGLVGQERQVLADEDAGVAVAMG